MSLPLAVLEAVLRIRLELIPQRAAQVCIDPGRQIPISRLLVGQLVEEVLHRVPRIYSVCAMAQGTAAVEACENALGVEVSPHQHNARRLLVFVESAKEHLWRILFHWPRLLGEGTGEPVPSGIGTLLPAVYQAAMYRQGAPHQCGGGRLSPDLEALNALCRQLELLLAEVVFGMAPSTWSTLQEETALAEWSMRTDTIAARLVRRVIGRGWAQLGRSSVAALPPLELSSLHARLGSDDGEDFAARPTWEGCRETTPLTRNQHHPLVANLMKRHGNGLLPRVTARLAELADFPRLMGGIIATLEPDPGGVSINTAPVSAVGLAQIEATRGRLIHRVAVRADRVSEYQIVAPTAWNFHPSGVAAEALVSAIGIDPEGIEEKAALLIEAIDPCVQYRLSVRHEGS